jgi:subtilase family serine protease
MQKEIDMRNPFSLRITGALCIALAATAFAGPVTAGPVTILSSRVIEAPSLTEHVYYRRYYHRHYYRHYRHYRRYGYNPYYSPAGAVAGTAADVVTLPVRVLFGIPY